MKLHRHTLSTALAMMMSAQLFAATPNDGFFYGINLEPVAGASIEVAEKDPAVALIFAIDQKTGEATRQFNEWYLSARASGVNIFAIGVNLTPRSPAVVESAIEQRNLQMPVFLASNDMLLGDDYRIVVLDNDNEVKRFTTLDFPGLNAELATRNIQVSALPSATQTPPTDPATATTAPGEVTNVTVTSETTELPDGEIVTNVTTTTELRRESVVAGGATSGNVYTNGQFGFAVEFPPAWQYRIAARQDGAVALPPRGGKLDMRVWALAADGMRNPQQYVDQRLNSLSRTHGTRVQVERHFEVQDNRGNRGLDVTYSFPRPIHSGNPAAGSLVHRGRLQVFINNGVIKAASAEAPSGEFLSAIPVIDPFFHSFQAYSPSHI